MKEHFQIISLFCTRTPYVEVKTYFTRKKGKWYRKLESELENRRIEEEEQIRLKNERIGTPIC
ncbi:hypothetical protein [Bacillus thuringiensis]|uniref:hypothetical protein n=1 Tax=Bacillus thuringiensis TaxID=1428 RepID=UPI002015F199|nr:hypothetical protein [Bacillus thuringiensis]